jgi:muramidase (phage lysozyme)
MRFYEFKTIISEATKGNQADVPKFDAPGYFTVGDSHSNGVGNYGRGKTWKAMGMDGASAYDPMHMSAIDRIPTGSVVAISLGANDLGSKPIPQIVSQVEKVINAALGKKLQVVYLLPTATVDPKNKAKRDELRSALKNSIGVPVYDLGTVTGGDGLHQPMGVYGGIANKISSEHKPSAGTGTTLGTSDAKPGAPTAKDRIKDSTDLEQGPPFPPDLKDDVMKMQQSLQELGYSVGRLGVDGKYGPATAAAVAAFKKDYSIDGSGSSFGEKEFSVLSQIDAGQVKRVAASKPEVANSAPMAPLAMDSVTKGRVGEVLDLVAGPESRGHYDMMFGGKRDPDILKMTMKELTDYQLRHSKKYGSSAAGRYQIMHFNTLSYARKAGLDPDKDIFSPENQDKMGIVFLREAGLEDWLKGIKSDEKFLERLSRIWAGVPSPSKGGASYYGGVGLNKHDTQLGMKTALNSLQQINTMA